MSLIRKQNNTGKSESSQVDSTSSPEHTGDIKTLYPDVQSHKALLPWVSFVGASMIQIGLCTPVLASLNSSSGLEGHLNKIEGLGEKVVLAGLALGFSSKINMGFLNLGERLITKGIYGIIRNPIYLAFRMCSVGMAIDNPSIESLIAGAGVFAGTEITARLEEENLKRAYGERFSEYIKKVPRWIPFSNYLGKASVESNKSED